MWGYKLDEDAQFIHDNGGRCNYGRQTWHHLLLHLTCGDDKDADGNVVDQGIRQIRHTFTNVDIVREFVLLGAAAGGTPIDLSQGSEKEILKSDKVVPPKLARSIPEDAVIVKNKPKTAAEINVVVKEYEATINSAIRLAGSATADWTPAKRAAFRRAVRRAIRVNCRRKH